MATSVVMSLDHDNTGREIESDLNGSEETRPQNAKPGRRRSKLSDSIQKKKKQPKRGMGVAQLETLRLQERCNNFNPLHSLTPQTHHFLPPPFVAPATNRVGQSGSNQTLLLQMIGNGGFHGPVVCSGFGAGFSDPFLVDPYRFGAPPTSSFHVGNVIETSKELSSIPNSSQRCGFCHKKQRSNGEKLGRNEVRNMTGNINEEKEVLKEYELFPGKSSSVAAIGGEASSWVTATPTSSSGGFGFGFGASTCIDLSLKLSY